MSDKMTREDLEAIFNWNTEFSTAFKDIKAEDITKSPITRMMESPGELSKTVIEIWKEWNAQKERDVLLRFLWTRGKVIHEVRMAEVEMTKKAELSAEERAQLVLRF
ncbi:MAG: hypothetical protein ACREX4_13495, partial [Gammaproteobacteria bacterium]